LETLQISDHAPWLLLGPTITCEVTLEETILGRLSKPSAEIANEIACHGLRTWDTSCVPTDMLRQAATWIDRERTLSAICSRVVKDIHLLRADVGFDVSHSEPRWRRSIFVSVPERDDTVGAVRLAESIIHEAMHLHLTDFEEIEPLVFEFQGKMRSPWKTERRPYQGVMHGLFVFACLGQYFRNTSRIFEKEKDDAARNHCIGRVADIASDINSIDINELSAGLTSAGAALVRSWHRFGRVC
jgi:HEXXH motif-containing protein